MNEKVGDPELPLPGMRFEDTTDYCVTHGVAALDGNEAFGPAAAAEENAGKR